jgi:hypothetical protein
VKLVIDAPPVVSSVLEPRAKVLELFAKLFFSFGMNGPSEQALIGALEDLHDLVSLIFWVFVETRLR